MKEDLKAALEVLKKGGVILYPTDTIWGIGCDATNTKAVERIYQIKRREDSKSMLMLVDEPWRLADYVEEVPEIALHLVELSEKPLTIIYPSAKGISPRLVSEDGSLGIRVTSDEFCKKLISSLNRPLVSTSANFSGSPSPGYFGDIPEELIRLADYTVKWRQNEKGKFQASSILKLGINSEIEIIRK